MGNSFFHRLGAWIRRIFNVIGRIFSAIGSVFKVLLFIILLVITICLVACAYLTTHHSEEYDATIAFLQQEEYYEAFKSVLGSDRRVYNKGHRLFLEGKYDEADACFAELGDKITDYGYYHFRDLNVAYEFLSTCAEELEPKIACYIYEMPDGFRSNMSDLLFSFVPNNGYHSLNYSSTTKLLKLSLVYRSSDRILYAVRNNDFDSLNTEELEVYEKAVALVEQAKRESKDDFRLEMWFHDWLYDNVEYDTPTFEVVTTNIDEVYRQHSVLGVFIDGKADCQGYAAAFELLTRLAGFECRTIGGTANSGPHAWNMIKLDGLWYFVDTTFDDPLNNDIDGRSYVWLNFPYNAGSHVPDWDLTGIYEFAEKENPEYCYFSVYGVDLGSVEAAANYAVSCYRNGISSVIARVKGVSVDNNTMSKAIESACRQQGVGNASWSVSAYSDMGNTYVNVKWR